MTPEQREQLDQLIKMIKMLNHLKGWMLTTDERNQIIFYLEMLKDLARRLNGEWKKEVEE